MLSVLNGTKDRGWYPSGHDFRLQVSKSIAVGSKSLVDKTLKPNESWTYDSSLGMLDGTYTFTVSFTGFTTLTKTVTWATPAGAPTPSRYIKIRDNRFDERTERDTLGFRIEERPDFPFPLPK